MTRAAPSRWRREWLAVAVGTGMLALAIALFVSGNGIQVLPEDIAGPADGGGALWLVGALALLVCLPPAVAYTSGRRGWLSAGLAAVVGAGVVTVVVGNALPAVFFSASVTGTFALGLAGGVALRHERRVELVARAVAVLVLVAGSWLLSRAGVPDPLPLLTLAGLGAADRLADRLL